MDETARYVGRHEADIITIKEDLKEQKEWIAEIREYIILRKSERRIGFAIASALLAFCTYLGSWIPYFNNYLKSKGLN